MKNLIITSFVVGAVSLPALAKIDMGTPFSNNAVLQREREVPVWGTASVGNDITVEFAGNSVSTTVGADGKWMVKLPAMAASKENRTMTVKESEPGWFGSTVDTVEVNDVLVGEVWMCAGQSNTDCPVWGANPRYRDGWGAMSLMSTFKPFVRLVKTPLVPSDKPRYGYKVEWMQMTPSMYDLFKQGKRMPSAIGYYYALEIANTLDIPVGLVDSSWGGTNIDAWTPPSGYVGLDELKDVAALPVLDKAKFDESRKNGIYKGKGIYGQWQQQPTALWNGMVAAYAPMACRGFIWYQGCHNSGESQRYAVKMHALYNGWAKEFENPDFSLYFVQLAPFRSNWMGLVEAQNKFTAEEPHAGIAVTADVGNFDDIHPNAKAIVGKRLAIQALKRNYGLPIAEVDSPVIAGVDFANGTATMTFKHAKGWYVYAPNRSIVPAFELAGADGKWVAAKLQNVDKNGIVTGDKLVVKAEGVANPTMVRYMGQNLTMGTVFNEASLPLGPFTYSK